MSITHYKQKLIAAKHLHKQNSVIQQSAELDSAEAAAAALFSINEDSTTAEFERSYNFVIEKLGL